MTNEEIGARIIYDAKLNDRRVWDVLGRYSAIE